MPTQPAHVPPPTTPTERGVWGDRALEGGHGGGENETLTPAHTRKDSPPLYVFAASLVQARDFVVHTLRASHHRLRFVQDPYQLRGLTRPLIYVLHGADRHPHYRDLIRMARNRRAVLACIEDRVHWRLRHPPTRDHATGATVPNASPER